MTFSLNHGMICVLEYCDRVVKMMHNAIVIIFVCGCVAVGGLGRTGAPVPEFFEGRRILKNLGAPKNFRTYTRFEKSCNSQFFHTF